MSVIITNVVFAVAARGRATEEGERKRLRTNWFRLETVTFNEDSNKKLVILVQNRLRFGVSDHETLKRYYFLKLLRDCIRNPVSGTNSGKRPRWRWGPCTKEGASRTGEETDRQSEIFRKTDEGFERCHYLWRIDVIATDFEEDGEKETLVSTITIFNHEKRKKAKLKIHILW